MAGTIQLRTVSERLRVRVLQIKEHIVDVVKFTSQEGLSEPFVEEFVLTCQTSMSWKRSWRQFNSFMKVCIQELFVEEIVDIPVPQIMEEIVDVETHPADSHSGTIVDLPVLQIQVKSLELYNWIMQERVSELIVEQVVDIPIRWIPQEQGPNDGCR